MLPDIVPHEKAGLICSIDADELAEAWLRLIQNRELRSQLGQGALEHARKHFRMEAVGPCLETFYRGLKHM
jgi:glycosyltransferase involved in cell wall biosynthesis